MLIQWGEEREELRNCRNCIHRWRVNWHRRLGPLTSFTSAASQSTSSKVHGNNSTSKHLIILMSYLNRDEDEDVDRWRWSFYCLIWWKGYFDWGDEASCSKRTVYGWTSWSFKRKIRKREKEREGREVRDKSTNWVKGSLYFVTQATTTFARMKLKGQVFDVWAE